MHRVATHLRDHAQGLVDPIEIDLFGRSAFNRFYYAAYWVIRTNFPDISKNWVKLGHKALPDLISTSVKKDMLALLKKLWSKKVITHTDYYRLESRINISTSEIARLLTICYSVRCTADYDPEICTQNIGGTLTLDGRKISSFQTLHTEITQYAGMLKACRTEMGL